MVVIWETVCIMRPSLVARYPSLSQSCSLVSLSLPALIPKLQPVPLTLPTVFFWLSLSAILPFYSLSIHCVLAHCVSRYVCMSHSVPFQYIVSACCVLIQSIGFPLFSSLSIQFVLAIVCWYLWGFFFFFFEFLSFWRQGFSVYVGLSWSSLYRPCGPWTQKIHLLLSPNCWD